MNENGLLAFYEISKIIKKDGKPHTIDEPLILQTISIAITSLRIPIIVKSLNRFLLATYQCRGVSIKYLIMSKQN
ncbi:hypothetical protein HZS_1711 [Henneguya salminicola]|nr:hypothetical protein HZS_1711 [Henneguya salminicola]